jgi:hypothetical protein
MTDASPYTIPEPTAEFITRPSNAAHLLTVGTLIRNLVNFADFYERATAAIDSEPVPALRMWHRNNRDAQAQDAREKFAQIVGIDTLRAYLLQCYGEELTVRSARQFLGDLMHQCRLTTQQAEALALTDATSRLIASVPPEVRAIGVKP